MLQDESRTASYIRALEAARSAIEGKVVMDVGAGTGILSAVCARLGARRVYAVEASSIAGDTEQVMRDNGLDAVVTVLNTRVEDLEFLPDYPRSVGGSGGGGGGGGSGNRQVVDVIVSEWMGTLLVAESMMQSVLYARNTWLRGYCEEREGGGAKGKGVIIPSVAELYLAPISASQYLGQHLRYWDSKPYGIDLSAVKSRGEATFVERPVHSEVVSAEQLFGRVGGGGGGDDSEGGIAAAAASAAAATAATATATTTTTSLPPQTPAAAKLVASFDLADARATPPTVADNFGAEFCFRFRRGARAVDGFVAWFDVRLYGDVTLSTSPLAPSTHWRQAQLLYPEPLVGEEKGEAEAEGELKGKIAVVRNAKWPRHYEVAVEVDGQGQRRWKMWR